ncbi:ComF family protein [Aquibacillus sp. 3ASR75-11]|uniref:ComF family protein n=1 Tax=Terrihalobacillus insolitus TaxID=2950438 RepID=A0A9X4AM30_9BACI|nr:ComF family protein [Terrihalobacillus insolitus]MDC3412221.1 ComF family protein [Terrihalobacillus insolitus]MDC3423085.1 ComF family protein [Terrihalobacillus insolitus]
MFCIWCDTEIMIEVNWNNLFYPDHPKPLCDQCETKLDFLSGNQCTLCGRNWDFGNRCRDCARWEKDPEWQGVLTFNRSVFSYSKAIQEMVAKWKYRGDYVLVESFRQGFQAAFTKQFSFLEVAVIVPIPLSLERLSERGFNQAEALADFLNATTIQALTRIHGEKQSKKTRRERLVSTNPFEVVTHIKTPVILIDDIYTTGITIRHAAKKLRDAGCPEVYSFTLIRG